jgi:hypothetical protein
MTVEADQGSKVYGVGRLRHPAGYAAIRIGCVEKNNDRQQQRKYNGSSAGCRSE